MARKPMGLPAGVEFAGQSVRIRFTWNGERRCETLAHPQTPKGIKAAATLRDNVISLAKHGVLDEKRYAELFPSSSYSAQAAGLTFAQYAQTWIDSLEIVPGTRRNYKGSINMYWIPSLATVPMTAITPMLLRQVIGETKWDSPTIKRTAISRVSALFKAAVRDEVIERNPATAIKLPGRTKKAIDPFTVDEADAIIEWMYANFTARAAQIYAAYFEFAFYCGMRTGELRALRWDEIDLEKRVAHVCRIVVDGKIEERTKTKYTRTVMLNSRAMHALTRARKIADARLTQHRRKRQESPFVFPPSGGSEFILSSTTPGGHFAKALEALQIKARSQYNCRHTYATMCLMAGMNPAFIAGQLGHSVQVLLSTYARWLSSTTDWSEVGKLESQIGTKLVQA
ncbi:tyrosine-type recombinase/integrase [Pseudomonas gregormendelii]|uniref:Tyrosine-type recombinase/integrase n=1 Tax=Pseudomonas gregormendelii TaxID=1628277 RepID=A0ABS3AFN9_9PSED|nr:tyrosine-type recombinase/integrase [Pseudomonas gregormendelii]MBN3965579.1 tyrosine-type recombinase/integrase [Pseudomonas gregormendelii]